MKKITKIALVGVATLTLTACHQTIDNTNQKISSDNSVVEKNSEVLEVSKGELLKVGQFKYDDLQGKVTLLKIATPKEKLNYDGFEITIDKIKILSLENPSKEMMKALDQMKNQMTTQKAINDKKMYMIQISYNVENNKEENINWSGIQMVNTPSGEQLEQLDNIQIGNIHTKFGSHAKIEDEIYQGFITDSNIDSVTLTLLPVSNKDFQTIARPEPITINLK